MENETLRKIQLIQLEMLKIIKDICECHNIVFYLAYGTLLGSVRHKGFIPWDDDLDIMLQRQEYDRLMEILKKELPSGYWVQNYETDANYWQPYAKLRKLGTVYKEKGQEKLADDECGVWLDIFPLEYVHSSNRFLINLRGTIVKTISFSLRRRIFELPYSAFSRRYVPILLFWQLFSKQTLHRVQKLVMKQCGKGKARYLVDYIAGGKAKIVQYSMDYFEEKVKLQFEDDYFYAPGKYDEVLKQRYGDYMTLPPENERQGHNIDDFAKVVI